MSTSKLPEGISPEQLDDLINNPGTTLSGVVGGAPTVLRPASSINIAEPAAKGVRPQIGGHTAGTPRITRPSQGLAGKLAAGDEKMRREAQERQALERQEIEEHNPANLNSRIAYLERQLKKAMSEINKLKKEASS